MGVDRDIFDLSGRVAIVTGGNGGIGLGIAEGLAAAGASLSIVGRDEAKTAAAAERLRGHGVEALGFTADVSDEAAVAEVVASTAERLGRIDILVNNAGIARRGLLQDYTTEDWDDVVDINLKGMFFFSRAVHPHMVRAGGGKVINIGSMASIFGLDWAPAYGASKGGAVQLAKNMAVAWARDNIQANAVLPGWIETDLTAPLPEIAPERYALINSRIPQGRWGVPADFAGVAVFLASSASDYVTGAVITVDGGFSSF
jgi:2-deoxy-D-gluconate 3-dehydrogenase